VQCSAVSQSVIDSELRPRGGRLAQWLKSRGIAEMRDKIKYKGNKTKSNPYPNPVQSSTTKTIQAWGILEDPSARSTPEDPPTLHDGGPPNQTHHFSKAETHANQTLDIS
jgi:hypothetical protein